MGCRGRNLHPVWRAPFRSHPVNQSCSVLFPFLNSGGSGALLLCDHLPLSVRLQKLKREGDFFPSALGWEPSKRKWGSDSDSKGVGACLGSGLKQHSGVKQVMWLRRCCAPSSWNPPGVIQKGPTHSPKNQRLLLEMLVCERPVTVCYICISWETIRRFS